MTYIECNRGLGWFRVPGYRANAITPRLMAIVAELRAWHRDCQFRITIM